MASTYRSGPSRAASRSPRPFFPPSHYAEAGGYTTPKKQTLPANLNPDADIHFSPGDAFIPVSYAADNGGLSDSSFEYKNNHSGRVQLGEIDMNTQLKSEARVRRLSQLNLPLVEPSLCPSLRDTIDKMTRPPSRSPSSAHLDQPKPTQDRAPSPHPPYSPSSSKFSGRSPRVPAISQPSTPNPNSMDAKSRPAPPTKSALKSALRAPTPKLFSPKSDAGELPQSASPSGALKSVKSLLRRKSSSSSSTSNMDAPPRPPKDISTFPPTRSRSRTDPGAFTTSVLAQIHIPNTPVISSKGDMFVSNIPRARVLAAKTSSPFRPTDDSDLEYRYEVESRDRRRLTVTNADVIASSSSSEGTMLTSKFILGRPNRNAHNNMPTRSMTPSGIPSPKYRNPSRNVNGNTNPDRWRDAERIYDNPRSQFETSPIPSEHGQDNTADLDSDERRKRRAALIGLVTGLEQTKWKMESSDEDSVYRGEPGLAVSGSGGVNDPVNSDSESEYEDGKDSAARRGIDQDIIRIHSERSLNADRRNPVHHSMPTFSPILPPPSAQPPSSPGFSSNHATPSLRGSSRSYGTSRSPIVYTPSTGTPTLATPKTPCKDREREAAFQARSPKINPPYDSQTYDAVKLAQHSRSAAARERQAFGIPPSESDDECNHTVDGTLPHDESLLSTIGSGLFEQGQDPDELSVGAEALFRTISGSRGGGDHTQLREGGSRSTVCDQTDRGRHMSQNKGRQRSRTPQRMQRDTASSPHDRPNSERSQPSSWRATVDPQRYQQLAVLYGDVELQRQEVIWEIRGSEGSFVESLLSIVRLFILPLRVQDSKTWISGVPSDVANFLDWLEDIVNLHSQLHAKLQALEVTQDGIIECFSEMILPFVPHLQVYQPYLVRLDDVVRLVARMTGEAGNDFGEFVQLQQESECGRCSLERLLTEPSKRIMSYSSLFTRLLELTPKFHKDFFKTFCLQRATNMILKVMEEVRVREEEYEALKCISNQISGLPPSFTISTRERRLLYQGYLILLGEEADTGPLSELTLSTPKLQHVDTFVSPSSSQTRSNRLVDAINDWDARRERSGSTSTTSTGHSSRSYASTSSSDFPKTPPPFRRNNSHSDDRANHLHGKKSPGTGPSSQFGSHEPSQLRPLVRVFVFTDLLLVAIPTADMRWALSKRLGLARILDIDERSMESEGIAFALDVIALQGDGVHAASRSMVQSLHLEVPDSRDDSCTSLQEERATWLSAFRRCRQSFLHSVANPLDPGSLSPLDYLDIQHDVEQKTESLLAAGLPLPKSPSLQIEDKQRSQQQDHTRWEREERGWWSVRFQHVLREMQKESVAS